MHGKNTPVCVLLFGTFGNYMNHIATQISTEQSHNLQNFSFKIA